MQCSLEVAGGADSGEIDSIGEGYVVEKVDSSAWSSGHVSVPWLVPVLRGHVALF